MKKWLIMLVIVSCSLLITACSGGEESSDHASMSSEKSASSGGESADIGESENLADQGKAEGEQTKQIETDQIDRKIIYTANLIIEVKNYNQAMNEIQKRVSERGGYIVESNTSGDDSEEGSTNGMITARIPKEYFREFITFVEEGSSDVLQSSISGQDVTEEYIDLESRLKAKQVVEKRLLSFMEQAKKTEDLLAISEDLAKVQEEIEGITGRMNYLQNKSELATVTIQIQENNVKLSGINDEELNTWDKTKQQFLKSINFLTATFSSLFVFFIGSLPILILLGIIGVAVFFIVKKYKKEN